MLVVAFVAWLALLYAVSWHVVGGTSDNATSLLAGRDMVHGNVFLHGWHLGADSFWLLDLPLLGMMATTFGLGPAAFHVEPTAVAAVTVLLAMACAAGHAKRRDAAIAATTTFLIIGLPSAVFAAFFLQGPVHVMTTLCCLLAFALLAPARGRGRLVGGCLVLVAAVAGDPLALVIGAGPVVVAGLAVCRTRGVREGSPVIGAGVVAAVFGEALVRAVGALGGFRRLPTLGVAGSAQWVPNLRLAAHDFLYTFGVRVLAGWPAVAGPARLVRLVGLVLVVSSIGIALVNLVGRLALGRGRGTWIEDVCALGCVGSVMFYVAVVFPGENVSRTRYLLPAMVFGAVLAGRLAGALVGGAIERAAGRWSAPAPVRNAARGVAAAVALVLVAGYVAGSVAPVRTRNPPNPAIALAAWLSAHHLTQGWGGYWDATVTTVAGDDHVRVDPVIVVRGRLHGFGDLASDSWFASSSRSGRPPATFLVYEPGAPWGNVNRATATATFGPPDERTRVGNFEVLVWDHDTRPQLRRLVIS